MSRYEWERGTIKLPSKEYAKFRSDVIKKWNELEERRFQQACEIFDQVTKETKGKRNVDKPKLMRDRAALKYGNSMNQDELHRLKQLLTKQHDKPKLLRPKKKDLDLKPISRQCSIPSDDGSITFHDKEKSVTWDVSENNHACETARATPIARYFFQRLSQITWTRGSGGTIVGNDEYNRESEYEGGGGNYTTASYQYKSPEQKAKEARENRRFAPNALVGGGRYGHYGRRW